MYLRAMAKVILFIFVFIHSGISAQDNNYWFQTFGAPSSAVAGNVIAGVRDNSAAFYNPGVLGFIKDPDISVSGNVYGYRYFKLENGLGPEVDVFTGGYLLYPQMLSGVFEVGKEENPWHINFNWLSRHYGFKIINERHEEDFDVIQSIDGLEHFSGSLDYFQELSEQWVGIGVGRPLNDYFSFGLSVFGTYRWQLNRFEKVLEAYPMTNFVNLPDGTTVPWYTTRNTTLQRVQFENFQVILKAGLAFEKGRLKLGLTATAPSINLSMPLIDLGYVTRDQQQQNLGKPYSLDYTLVNGLFDYRVSDKIKKISTNHKKPLSIGFGAEYSLQSARIMWSGEYFFSIDTYAVIRGDQRRDLINPPFLEPFLERPNYMTIYESNRAVFNWGIGYEHFLKNGWSVHGGFRTDKYYHRTEQSKEWEGAMSLLPLEIDFIHYNAGFTVPTKSGKFTLVFHLATGKADDREPIANMVNPIDFNDETYEVLTGTVPTETKLTHFQTNMIIGYTHQF